MKKGFLSITLISVFILSLALAGCSKNTNEQSNTKDQTNTKSLKSLSIGVMPDLDSIPLIVAEHNGYFKAEGLDVKLEHFKSAPDRDAALQAGKIDGVISDMLSVIFLNDNGFKAKITSKTDGSYKLIAGKNSGISDMKQASNKSVGLSKNTIIEYSTDRLMQASNIDVTSIQKIAIPQIPTRLEMLNNGKLDMATLPEPLASTAVLSGGKVLCSSNELNINPGIMLFTDNVISSKTSEIKAFYKAYNKAVTYLKETKKQDYIDFVIKDAGFPETVKDTLKLPDYTEAVMPSNKEFTEVQNWLKAKNLTTKDNSFEALSNDTLIK